MPDTDLRVSFRSGNYEYYDNTNYIPGCIYYLTQYTDPEDETSGIVDTYIFLDGVRYGAAVQTQAMEYFGSYTYNSSTGVGVIEPDATTFIIDHLQVNTLPINTRDVVPKKYVDDHIGNLYIITDSDTESQIASIITNYLNDSSKNMAHIFYEYTDMSNRLHRLPISRIITDDAEATPRHYYWEFEDTYFNGTNTLKFGKYVITVIINGTSPTASATYQSKSYQDYINTSIPTDSTDYDGCLTNIGAIKTYVSSRISQWQSI